MGLGLSQLSSNFFFPSAAPNIPSIPADLKNGFRESNKMFTFLGGGSVTQHRFVLVAPWWAKIMQ